MSQDWLIQTAKKQIKNLQLANPEIEGLEIITHFERYFRINNYTAARLYYAAILSFSGKDWNERKQHNDIKAKTKTEPVHK